MRTTVVEGLPSSQTSPMLGSLVSGLGDVAFIGNQLYALEAGAGCSHGLIGTDNELLRVNSNGTTTPIVNLSAFQRAHPVQHPEADDFEPDGTWYSMVAVRGSLYAVEPNHGEIDRIDPVARTITRVIDVSASEGHIVPTAIAYKGNFFFGNLGVFPITPGSSSIFKVTPSGNIGNWFDHLTTVVGVAFGSRDRMYVLESMTAPGFPGPGQLFTGRVIQIDPNGRRERDRHRLFVPDRDDDGPRRCALRSEFRLRRTGSGARSNLPRRGSIAEDQARGAPPQPHG